MLGPIDIALSGAAIGVRLFAFFAASRMLGPLFGRIVVEKTSTDSGVALARRARRNGLILLGVGATGYAGCLVLESIDFETGRVLAEALALILLPLGVGGVVMWGAIWACSGLFGRMSRKRARYLASGGAIRRLRVEAVVAMCLLGAAIWLAVVVGSMPR